MIEKAKLEKLINNFFDEIEIFNNSSFLEIVKLYDVQPKIYKFIILNYFLTISCSIENILKEIVIYLPTKYRIIEYNNSYWSSVHYEKIKNIFDKKKIKKINNLSDNNIKQQKVDFLNKCFMVDKKIDDFYLNENEIADHFKELNDIRNKFSHGGERFNTTMCSLQKLKKYLYLFFYFINVLRTNPK